MEIFKQIPNFSSGSWAAVNLYNESLRQIKFTYLWILAPLKIKGSLTGSNCFRSPVYIIDKPPYGRCLSRWFKFVNTSCIDWFLLAPTILRINIIFKTDKHNEASYLISSIRISCNLSYLKLRSALLEAPCTITPDLFLLMIGSADSIVFPMTW